MNKLVLVLITICLVLAGCGPKELTPATEVIYEGAMLGNEEFTYKSAGAIAAKCIAVKECMGLSQKDYPLPNIKGMGGGNAVECGTNPDGTPRLKLGCYFPGLIVVPQGADLEIISHECVHHWLYESTGDADATHSSSYFLTCGGSHKLEKETD